MSNVPAVQEHTGVARRTEEELSRGLARLRTEADFLAGSQLLSASYRLDRDRRPRPKADVVADVMVVLIDARNRGLPTSLSTINKYAVINGAAIPMGQLLIGLVARHGHDLWIEERSEEKAVVVLHNSRTGRDHRVEYTMAEAKASASYKKSVSLGVDKSVWLSHPADMLVWRAVNRAVRFGAPDIAAGFGLADEFADPSDIGPGLAVDVDYQSESLGDQIADSLDEQHALGAGYDTPAAPIEEGRIARLHRQINALPPMIRAELVASWAGRNLPPLTHPDLPGRIDEAEDLVDEITARALAPEADQSNGVRVPGVPPTHAGPPVAGQGTDPPQSASSSGRPLSLGHQLAELAKAAGVDYHHVIAAVTGGLKTSSKDLDAEERDLVFKALDAITKGEYTVVDRDGVWKFDDSGRAFD